MDLETAKPKDYIYSVACVIWLWVLDVTIKSSQKHHIWNSQSNLTSYTINVIFRLSCLVQLNNDEIITETSYPKPTIKTLSCWGQLNNHEIITETSYPKPTIKTFTLHYKYREPAKPTCRGLCAVTSALQTIVRGI